MRISRQAKRDGKQLFRLSMKDGVLDANRVRETVKALVASKPRGFEGVLGHFKRLIKFELERRTARIESAVGVQPDMQNEIQKALTARFGPGLEFIFAENPALIGGLRVQVGSDVYDGSVRGRLAIIAEGFK